MVILYALIITAFVIIGFIKLDLDASMEDLDTAVDVMEELTDQHTRNTKRLKNVIDLYTEIQVELDDVSKVINDDKFQHFIKNYEFYKEILEEREKNVLPKMPE